MTPFVAQTPADAEKQLGSRFVPKPRPDSSIWLEWFGDTAVITTTTEYRLFRPEPEAIARVVLRDSLGKWPEPEIARLAVLFAAGPEWVRLCDGEMTRDQVREWVGRHGE